MIMHKLNSIADLFLKLGPVIVMWNVHWNINNTEERTYWGFYETTTDHLSLSFIYKYIFAVSTIYLLWAIPYFVLVPLSTQKYGEIRRIKEFGEIKGKIVYFIFHYLIFICSGLVLGLAAYFYQPFHIFIIIITC